MEMPGGWTMSMMWMRMPGQTWLTSGLLFLLMWLTMMVAMMLPSVMPVLSGYRRSPAGEATPCSSTLLVAIGYFGVWTALGLATYLVCVSWAYATMHWSGLSRLVPVLTGLMLAISGAIQFSPWKMAALKRCRGPLACAARQKTGHGSAWRFGLKQGASCAICCAGPMLALLVLGAMDLAIMILIAVLIALEKLAPRPELVVRVSGAAGLLLGVMIMLRHF
jgi:predicted metal-binding membrane protein